MLADPTLDAALSVWGETVTLQRTPAVSLSAVYSEPDTLSQLGNIGVDNVDGVLTLRSADIVALALQPRERFLIRAEPFHVINVRTDDGAGATIFLKKLRA